MTDTAPPALASLPVMQPLPDTAGMRSDQALQMIAQLRANQEFTAALSDPLHPNSKAFGEYETRLYERAYPEQAQEKPAQAPRDDNAPSVASDPMFAAPETPEAYRIAHAGETHSPELENEARQMFHAVGLPATIGNNLSQLWNDYTSRPRSDQELQADAQAGAARLQAEWGDQFQAKIGAARKLVEKAGPRAMELLEQSGMASSWFVIQQLALAAEARGIR